MPKSNPIKIIAQDNNRCGEGPIWDEIHQRLLWTDIESALVYQFTPASTEKKIISQGLTVSGIGLNQTGEFIFVGGGGLHLWRGQDDFRTIIARYEGQTLAFNDMIVDIKGRVYAGTIYWDQNGMVQRGKLYLIEGNGAVRVVDDGIELSNGLGFSLDHRTLYFTDSAARKIYAYDIDALTGELFNKRLFVSVPTDEGIPDGMTVDAEGFIWSAQWYGSQVVRYDPEGKVERRIKFPVTQVSSVAFGGKNLNELYVTTAADNWSSPLAPPGYDFSKAKTGGSLYRVTLDIQGRLEHRARFVW